MVNPTSAIGTMVSGSMKLGGKGLKKAWDNKSVVKTQAAWHFGGQLKNQTEQGRSLGASFMRAAATGAAYTIAPEVMYGRDAAKMATSGATAAIQFRRRKGHELAAENRNAQIGRGFQDTEQAHTMRQAATQQIQANKMNARSALGGEARIFSGKRINQHTRPYV